MLEVSDTVVWGQEYQAIVFLGTKDKSGLLAFDNASKYTFDIPMDKSWSSSLTKIDSADVNADSCGDLVFTEYKQGFSKDSYIAKIAINQGDGKTFKFATDKMVESLPLEESIVRIIAAFEAANGGGEDVGDYFAIDWSDANNDGRDDLHLFWRDMENLYVNVLLSQKTSNPLSEFAFAEGYEATLPNFMTSKTGSMNYSARNIDTEDFNNDGIGDIIVFYSSGTSIDLYPALGKIENNTLSYTIDKGHNGKGADLDLFSFEKIDHYDANFDGCADYVHLGVLETKGKPDRNVATYKLSSCK